MTAHDVDFESLFRDSPISVLALLPDAPTFTIVAATDAYLAVTGQTHRDQVIGRGIFDLFPDNPDDPGGSGVANLRASLERVVASRGADTMAVQKYDIRDPDGTFVVRHWSPRNTPVLGPDGEVRYILHRVEDITELVRASELGEELRGRARETEQEMLRMRRMWTAQLEAANRELEAFSYSVSHDLRAPLRHVIGFAELLDQSSEAAVDGRARHYTATIVAAARKMERLIDDLLEFSRMGRAPLAKRHIRLNDLVSAARDEAMAAVGNPARQVEWQIDPLPEVEADPSLLHQAVLNLLSNALKYSSTRPLTRIHVGTRPVAPGEVALFVRDNGVGFNPDYQQRLFRVFQRLHSERDFPGTGIGLANVQRVISRHGGRVWAESAVDSGATFWFSLPAH